MVTGLSRAGEGPDDGGRAGRAPSTPLLAARIPYLLRLQTRHRDNRIPALAKSLRSLPRKPQRPRSPRSPLSLALSLSSLPLSSTSLVRGLACSAFSDRHTAKPVLPQFTLQQTLLGLSSFDRVARDLKSVDSILHLPVSAIVRPLVYRAVRGGHELRPVPPAAKALVAALSVPSSLLQWLEARLFVFDARCVEIPCYTNSGDAPRKISILVVVSLWFGRLLLR